MRRLFIGLLLCVAAVAPARAQSPCRPVDYEAKNLLGHTRELVASADSVLAATRVVYGLPQMDSSLVVIVTDSIVCKQAALAYERRMAEDTTIVATSRSVYVVKAGDRYMVLDPDETSAGGWFTIIIVSTGWAVVALFAG